jgi:hypothetical protein
LRPIDEKVDACTQRHIRRGKTDRETDSPGMSIKPESENDDGSPGDRDDGED